MRKVQVLTRLFMQVDACG